MTSSEPPAPLGISRRALLTGVAATAAAAPLVGCTGGGDAESAGTTATSTVTPAPTTAIPEGDAARAADVLGDEQALLGFCTVAVQQVRRRERGAVAAVRDRQRAIVAAVRDAMTDPQPAVSPTPRVPDRPPAVLRDLTVLLAAAEERRLADCLAVESGPFARLLASVAASHAVAVEQVRALR